MLEDFRRNSTFCDVALILDDGTCIKAHRIILANGSNYFNAMFTGGLAEKNKYEIEIHDVSSETLKTLVNYLYTTDVELSHDNVVDVIIAANMLQFPVVDAKCTKFLEDQLGASNALSMYKFAREHNCVRLANVVERFIYAKFASISKVDEFLNLPMNDLIQYLRSEKLNVFDEYPVLEAVIRWSEHCPKERLEHFFAIWKQVQAYPIDEKLIKKATKSCTNNLLKNMLKTMSQSKGIGSPQESAIRRRVSLTLYLIDIGNDRDTKSVPENKRVRYLDTCLGQWHRQNSQGFLECCGRCQPATAALGPVIYVVGGKSAEGTVLQSADTFDTKTSKWSQATGTLEVGRYDFGLCELGGCLYAFGGRNENGVLASIEKYDPLEKEWHVIGHMPQARYNIGLASHKGHMYIVGGIGEQNAYLNDVICYNVSTNNWEQLPPQLSPRRDVGVASLGDHLYVVGGHTTEEEDSPSEAVEKYSFQCKKWIKVSPLKRGVSQPRVAAANGYLYVLGGESMPNRKNIGIPDVVYYSPQTDTWKSEKSLPRPRSPFSVVVL